MIGIRVVGNMLVYTVIDIVYITSFYIRELGMCVVVSIVPESSERQMLKQLARSRPTSVRLTEWSTIVLLATQLHYNEEIAEAREINRQKAVRWRNRYYDSGLAGIEKYALKGERNNGKTKRAMYKVIRLAIQAMPDDVTHWSRRLTAQRVGVSESSLRRIWRVHGPKAHRVATYKQSNDKHFQETLEDVVGLYLAPLDNSVVLRCEEKSQIHALDRTQRGLPIKRGQNALMIQN